METREFIESALARIKRETARVVNGLSYHELVWRPGPECNSIGLILLHMTRSEDSIVQRRILDKLQVWESGKWYEKFNLPLEGGSHFTAEEIVTFRVPELADLLSYAEAVRTRTIEELRAMMAADFDRMLNMPRFGGDITVGGLFSLVVVHMAEHDGEMSYLRGVQRGLDK